MRLASSGCAKTCSTRSARARTSPGSVRKPVTPSRTTSAAPSTRVPTTGTPLASGVRSEEHTSELQSPCNLVCRLLLEKKNLDELEDLRAENPLHLHALPEERFGAPEQGSHLRGPRAIPPCGTTPRSPAPHCPTRQLRP